MMGTHALAARNRAHHRVPVEAFCTELEGEQLRHALVVELSQDGLRLQRPVGGRAPRALQLELEIPGIDEIVWARGEIRFDEVWRVPSGRAAPLAGVVRTSGVRLVALANRHRRMLREYVMESWRQSRPPQVDDWLLRASCYQRG